jgi:hypothetical protein
MHQQSFCSYVFSKPNAMSDNVTYTFCPSALTRMGLNPENERLSYRSHCQFSLHPFPGDSFSQANPSISWTRPTDLFCHNQSHYGCCAQRTAAQTRSERVGRSGSSSTSVAKKPHPKRRRDGGDMRDRSGAHPIRIVHRVRRLSARCQRASLAETGQFRRVEKLSHRGRAQHHSEMRRNWRCGGLSKSVTPVTLLSSSI